MTWRVIVGTLSIFLTMVLLGYVGVTELDRMASFTTSYESRQIETGAALFENNCQTCHGGQGQGIEGVAPSLNAPDLFDGTRLQTIGWSGTTEDYVRAAIAGGRPRPSAAFATYPQRMPTWGEQFGGPMRTDQVDSVVAYVMNWGTAFANATPVPTAVIEAVGTDITVELPAEDAEAGKALSEAKGCTGCHITSAAGPAWLASADANGEGIATRAAHRFTEAGYAGTAASVEQYLFESIVLPSAHLVPGASYQANGQSIMPGTYGGSLDKQNVADLLAYLLTLK